jgi:hypothetical protein
MTYELQKTRVRALSVWNRPPNFPSEHSLVQWFAALATAREDARMSAVEWRDGFVTRCCKKDRLIGTGQSCGSDGGNQHRFVFVERVTKREHMTRREARVFDSESGGERMSSLPN